MRKYAVADTFPARLPHGPGPSLLDPYVDYLLGRIGEGCENAMALWREIRERGYPGTNRQVHLLISSSEVGQRATQHRNVIEAAKAAGVKRIVYTSLLHADVSPLNLADEHRATESDLNASGLAHTVLRNGWYTENYTASIKPALAHSAFPGSAGDGRVSSAPRSDYADAAVTVLTSDGHDGKIYELAGDHAFTLTELAAEISRQSGTDIPYVQLPEADYAGIFLKAGIPNWLAGALASWDVAASQGALFDDGRQLSKLIGRPTSPLSANVAAALY